MTSWIRIALALIVGAHGLGHILFVAPLLTGADWGQSTRSWLLGSGGLARGVGSLIWIVAAIGFVVVTIGILRESNWWQTLAIAALVFSILGLVLFWATPATSPALSALLFNVVVMGSLLVLHWPPVTQAGS